MGDKPYDDQQGENDVEREGNRKVWKTKVDRDGVPNTAVRLRGLVDEDDTHPYIDDVMLAQSAVGLWENQIRTDRGEIHEAGERDDPNVCGIDDVTTIELEEQAGLDPWARKSGARFTKRPSASQLFNRNIRLAAILIASE